jgi:hypothetical protein
VDWWWLERYHLTPDQVAQLPLNTRDRVPFIAETADKVEADKAKRG